MKKNKMKTKIFLEYYYMIPGVTNVKLLSQHVQSASAEQIELWNELDLMEIILDNDSLIFQNAGEVFEDPLDLQFMEENSIHTVYQISFEQNDKQKVISIFEELLGISGGFLCSDTEDFMPMFTSSDIHTL